MANRSYLYSFNKNQKGDSSKIFDISEQNYEIPIIYKILVSENTEIVPSQIFENSLALKGDARAGRKKLNSFFRKLHKEKIYDDAELSDLEEMFQNHLDKYTLDYFLFEPIEVIEMSDVDADAEVKQIYSEIGKYTKMISRFLAEAKEGSEWSELGIDFTSYAYFSLGNEKEVAKIEKQFSNKKLAKTKELIAKKPTVKRYLDLIFELDKDTDTVEINETIEKALQLNPNREQYETLARHYQDLDKKIVLYKELQEKFTEEDYSYWISDAYNDLKQFDLALEYRLQYLINENNPLISIWGLESIIEDGQFNELEIYQNLSKKVKIKRVEEKIVTCLIEKGAYQKALDYYHDQEDFLSDKGVDNWRAHQHIEIHIIWAFLNKNKLDIAMKLAKNKHFGVISNYYKQQKLFAKSVYFFIKGHHKYSDTGSSSIRQFVYDFTEGEFAKEKVKITDLFKETMANIFDFKPKAIISVAKDLLDESKDVKNELKNELISIAEKLLIAIISHTTEHKRKAKMHLLLSKIYKKQGKKDFSDKHLELAYIVDDTLKFKHQYKTYFKEKEYKKSAKNYAQYIKQSNKSYEYYSDEIEAFFDKDLYSETILLIDVFLDKIDDNFDKMRFYNMLGLSYLWTENLDQAHDAFMSAYQYDDTEKVVHRNIALCAKKFFEKRKFDKALVVFTFCLKFRRTIEVYTYLGVIYDKRNDNAKALEYFTKALKKSPKNENCIKNMKYIEHKIKHEHHQKKILASFVETIVIKERKVHYFTFIFKTIKYEFEVVDNEGAFNFSRSSPIDILFDKQTMKCVFKNDTIKVFLWEDDALQYFSSN